MRVYTIGIGKKEGSPIPMELDNGQVVYAQNPDGTLALTKLDEELLTEIADITEGEYHHAADPDALRAVYESIWRLEKSRFKMKTFRKRHELCGRFLWPGLYFCLAVPFSYLSYWDPNAPREFSLVRLLEYVPLYALLAWAVASVIRDPRRGA